MQGSLLSDVKPFEWNCKIGVEQENAVNRMIENLEVTSIAFNLKKKTKTGKNQLSIKE